MAAKLYQLFAILLLGLGAASSSRACSCIGPNPVCSEYWKTPLIFLGDVVRIEHTYNEPPQQKTINGKTMTIVGPGEYLVHFDVAKFYRGSRQQEVVIHTPDQGSACGFGFEEGRTYIVYAFTGENGTLGTSHCSRTHQVLSPKDDADLQWLEALPKAAPGASIFGKLQTLQLNSEGGYDSAAASGIAVSIKGPQSTTVASDAEGKFRVDGLKPGKYTVSAEPIKEYTPFPTVTTDLQDRGCTEIPWTTRIDGHIRGHVYFDDGTPAPGLYLTVKSADAGPHEPWTWRAVYATSGPDGAFDFAQVGPGSYLMAANMDSTSLTENPYYRRAFFPGTVNRDEAAIISVGIGQQIDNLRFFLPQDSAKPSAALQVKVIGLDGNAASNALILAFDQIWENSVTPLSATADENGAATLTLRPSSTYDVEAYINLPDFSQACAAPVQVDAHHPRGPLILVISHHVGNCMPFKNSNER